MTTTLPAIDRAYPTGLTDPHTVLDLPVAVAALRGLTARIVPDRHGGPVIDGSHPLGAALVQHAPGVGAWVLTSDPTQIGDLRRRAAPTTTVVLNGHGERHQHDPGLSGADIAIVDEVAAAPATTPQLLRLTGDRRRMPTGKAHALLGFTSHLPRPGVELDRELDALRAGWTWWRHERGATRPVVLLRSGSTRSATRAANALQRWAFRAGHPAPIIRLDITEVCTTIAAFTVVTVLDCAEHPGVVEVVVDHLPPTFDGIRVAGTDRPDQRTSVLLRDAHRMVATEILGASLTPGAQLVAGGWAGLAGPLSVLEISGAPFSAASHLAGLSVT